MSLGNIILLTILGFLIMALHDLAQARLWRVLSRLTLIGYLMVIIPYLYIFLNFQQFLYQLPLINGLLWAGAVLGTGLMCYSVFIEIPLATRGSNSPFTENRSAYMKGTYSLSRHPGFLAMVLLNLFLAGLYPYHTPLLLLLILTAANLALILYEDIMIFPMIFDNYDHYKKKVPIIIKISMKK